MGDSDFVERRRIKLEFTVLHNMEINYSLRLTSEQVNEFKAAFDLFDKDGDGTVTTKEIGAVLRKMGQDPTEDELRQMIHDVDSDGNGHIDFEEFKTMMGKRMKEAEDSEEDMKTFFDLISSDGFITSYELTKLMMSYTEKVTGERAWPDDVAEDVSDMIREADIDGDGKITFEEFVYMMKSK